MLLTDEEKRELINTAPCRYDLVENVIAAYEAKLREQKPVMWKAEATNELDVDGEESLVICLTEEIMSTYRDESNYLITPLFEHPAPIQVTCQIYGHVVGACFECNTHAENDVNETNKVLADNYLKLTCGNPAPIPEGWTLVPTDIIDEFPGINQFNYNHDDVCTLNDWAIELTLAARSE